MNLSEQSSDCSLVYPHNPGSQVLSCGPHRRNPPLSSVPLLAQHLPCAPLDPSPPTPSRRWLSLPLKVVSPWQYGVCVGTHENAINLPVHMHMHNSKTEERALIDSGATETFLDYWTVKWLDLGTKLLDTSWPIINADGSPNRKGSLIWCTELMVTQNGKEALQWFFVTDLGSDQMILGFPWLQEWNPDIDWKRWTIKGGPISTQTLQIPEWTKIGLLLYQAQ